MGGLPEKVTPDPVKANLMAIDLIYAQCGAHAAPGPWDPIKANLMAIDLIYAEVCGPADVVTLDPYRANRFTIDLIESVPVAEDEWFAVD